MDRQKKEGLQCLKEEQTKDGEWSNISDDNEKETSNQDSKIRCEDQKEMEPEQD
jgi:hypothetical protein